MDEYIQFDTSDRIIGGVNVVNAIDVDKRLVFNESYAVLGEKLTAPSVYASYDLTVLGNFEADDIEIRGTLNVMGCIKAKRVSCLKAIFCSGDIIADQVFCSDIVANNIVCKTLSCPGNVITRTTIDIAESLETHHSVMAGEGILGGGSFSAKNGVAADYFAFEGEVHGKVLELETDALFGEPHKASPEKLSYDELMSLFRGKVLDGLKKAGNVDEDQLVEFISQLSSIDEDMISDWKMLTENLVELSYLDAITNLRDYLYIIMATKLLPEEIVGYETLEHVFDTLLIEAEERLDELPFHAKDVEDFAYSLKIACLCDRELRIEHDKLLDRIFQSIGIKYKTVQGFLG